MGSATVIHDFPDDSIGLQEAPSITVRGYVAETALNEQKGFLSET